MTNGCMTDNATLGDLHTPAPKPEGQPISGKLRSKVAQKKPQLGNPEPFFEHEDQTNWQSYTLQSRSESTGKSSTDDVQINN